MASALSVKKLSAEMAVKSYNFAPGSTAATAATTTWLDMRDYELLMVQVTKSVGTTALAAWKIQAASDASGTNATDVVTGGGLVAALGDQAYLECNAQQIRAADTTNVGLRYVNAVITLGSSGDKCIVSFLRGNPKFPQSALTADVIA